MSFWDDEAGYDLRDPKHPTFHDRMAFAADLARKRNREYAREFGPTTDDDRCECGGTFVFDRDHSKTTCDRCGMEIPS